MAISDANDTTKLDVKVSMHEVHRRFAIRATPVPTWKALSKLIKTRFELQDDFPLALVYYDNDGEAITVSTDEELAQAWPDTHDDKDVDSLAPLRFEITVSGPMHHGRDHPFEPFHGHPRGKHEEKGPSSLHKDVFHFINVVKENVADNKEVRAAFEKLMRHGRHADKPDPSKKKPSDGDDKNDEDHQGYDVDFDLDSPITVALAQAAEADEDGDKEGTHKHLDGLTGGIVGALLAPVILGPPHGPHGPPGQHGPGHHGHWGRFPPCGPPHGPAGRHGFPRGMPPPSFGFPHASCGPPGMFPGPPRPPMMGHHRPPLGHDTHGPPPFPCGHGPFDRCGPPPSMPPPFEGHCPPPHRGRPGRHSFPGFGFERGRGGFRGRPGRRCGSPPFHRRHHGYGAEHGPFMPYAETTDMEGFEHCDESESESDSNSDGEDFVRDFDDMKLNPEGTGHCHGKRAHPPHGMPPQGERPRGPPGFPSRHPPMHEGPHHRHHYGPRGFRCGDMPEMPMHGHGHRAFGDSGLSDFERRRHGRHAGRRHQRFE